MEWTETEVVGPSFLQLHELADDIDDVDPVLNLLYGILGDHEPPAEGTNISGLPLISG
jgi:tRNA pseudouridine-54 N-methylase